MITISPALTLFPTLHYELFLYNPPGMTEKPSVLVVDDDPEILNVYRLLFGRKYSVVEAASASAAQDILKDQYFDRVVCDGLESAYKEVINAALLAGIEKSAIVIVSGTEMFREPVEALGITFLLKGHYRLMDLLG